MKRMIWIIFFMLAPWYLYAQTKTNYELKTEPGKMLRVNLGTGGSIEIFGWDKKMVSIDVDIDRYDIDDYDIEVDEFSKGISVDVQYIGRRSRSTSVNLRIKVPRKYDLEMETMGGEIIIDGVEGLISGETMGGDLELSNLKGELELTTMGGDIRLENSELDGEVKTMGGEGFFNDVVGDVKGSSMGGDVIFKNVKKRGKKGSGKVVKISTMGGEIRVDDAPSGANVSTMGGDIHIRSAAEFVKAKTMGGDIDIEEIDGSARATTMGGDVTIKMVGDPDKGKRDVDISSMGGDIELTVPAGLSMEFDIKLSITKNSSRDYKIISDFPIKIEKDDEWDYSNGSARKYVYGTGEVSGGKNNIKIDTINGNIFIRKGR